MNEKSMINEIKTEYREYLEVVLSLDPDFYKKFERACDKQGEDPRHVIQQAMSSYIESCEK